MESGKKREFQNFHKVEEEEDDQASQTNPKRRICNSFPTGYVAKSDIASAQSRSQIMEAFLCRLVREEVESKVKSLQSSLKNNQPNDQTGEEAVTQSRTLKFKLCFLNQIASNIFTNNQIEAEGGEPLQVALCDITDDFDTIVCSGPLSSAQIEFVVVNGEFEADETHLNNLSDFNKHVLSQRVGKRPLIVGNDLKLYLKDGVGYIKSLSFTDNSSWLKSKKFRLGARIIDEKVLAKFPRIGEAASQPFRVLDHRGEGNKKHHPPKGEDEVWRLEGIGKNGVYHTRLSFEGIETVNDFLKTYNEKGPLYFRKLLGKKVPNKIWKAMIDNALECVHVANFAPSFEMQNSVGNEAFKGKLEVYGLMNFDDKFLETSLVDLDEEWGAYT